MYDIVPIEADTEHLSRYDYLIFLGWNSMTDEDMDRLYEYVNRGGVETPMLTSRYLS